MQVKTQDLRIHATKPLLAPAVLQDELPLPEAEAMLVRDTRRAIERILARRDDRLLIIAGPCSIHDPEAALEYAHRLALAARRHADELLIVMRVYFEKPRSTIGWKGLINDPALDGSFQINRGLRLARRLLLEVAAAGVPAGTEFLDTIIGQYYAELVSWGCIGARTVESQVHRELASGLSMPVGIKNRTDGDLGVAIDALCAARRPHWFPSLTKEGAPAVLGTTGNPMTHLVLRGGSVSGPVFEPAAIREAEARLRAAKLDPVVMVDCSHGNSGKDPARQPLVAAALARQVASGARTIIGAMLESNLIGGRQDVVQGRPLVHGQSITDACLSWEETLPVLRNLASAVRRRRKVRAR